MKLCIIWLSWAGSPIPEVIKMQKFVLRSKPKKCSKSSNIEKPKI